MARRTSCSPTVDKQSAAEECLYQPKPFSIQKSHPATHGFSRSRRRSQSGNMACQKPIEGVAVVVFLQMAQFVDHDVLDAGHRRDDQVDVQQDVALGGAASPAVGHLADPEPIRQDAVAFGSRSTGGEDIAEDSLGPLPEPARHQRLDTLFLGLCSPARR